MKKEEMYKILNGIDEKYLSEALNCRTERKAPAAILKILIPVAALIALFSLTVTFALPFMRTPKGTDETHPPINSPLTSEILLEEQIKDISYIKHDGHVIITGYLGNGEIVEIPESIGGVPVTEVDLRDKAEEPPSYTVVRTNSAKLTSLKLPANHKIVLNIGKKVTQIEPSLFHNSGIVSITVDDENTVFTSHGGILYSKDLTKLISCPSGSTLKVLSPTGKNSTSSACLPETLNTISENAFWGCTSIKSITLPEKVTTLEGNAFAGCTNLRELYLPLSLTKVSSDILSGCKNLMYLRTAQNKADFEKLNITVPSAGKVFAAMPKYDDQEKLAEIVDFYLQAEEIYSWFTRFNTIPCDAGTVENGRFLVTLKGVKSIHDLELYMKEYFSEEFIEKTVFTESNLALFAQGDEGLYVSLVNSPIEYNLGTKEYSLRENENGTLALTVRTTVDCGDVSVTCDCNYLLMATEQGYCFTFPFSLPAQTWYSLYLIEMD